MTSKKLLSRLFDLVLLIGLMAFLTACGDDDEAPTANNIVGTWQVDNVALEGQIGGINVNEQVNPTGTITFNSDFTGKENYTYTIPNLNIPIVENDQFKWTSSGNQLMIDPGDVDQQNWVRTINEANNQKGSYQVVDGSTNYTVTITLSK